MSIRTVTVNDLSGTDVTEVGLSLAGSPKPKAGDGADDHVIVNATDGADTVNLTGTQADGVTIEGLHSCGSSAPTDHPTPSPSTPGAATTPWTPPG